MFQVVKRDGKVADFHISKINDAIAKAFEATENQYDEDILNLISLRVTADFQGKIHDGAVTVEDIQDSVETVLNQTGYTEVAKAYILYRSSGKRSAI